MLHANHFKNEKRSYNIGMKTLHFWDINTLCSYHTYLYKILWIAAMYKITNEHCQYFFIFK